MNRSVAFLLAVGVLCGVLLMALFGPDHTTADTPLPAQSSPSTSAPAEAAP